jgi:hypothetical protein
MLRSRAVSSCTSCSMSSEYRATTASGGAFDRVTTSRSGGSREIAWSACCWTSTIAGTSPASLATASRLFAARWSTASITPCSARGSVRPFATNSVAR